MKYNVLVVDDSAVARSVLGKTISMVHPDVNLHFAQNGKEALEIVKNSWVDIIFADINMPVMNGIEMINQLEKDGLNETIPIIVVSTEGSTTRLDELKKKGVKGYIRKPFAPEKIGEIFNEVLGGGKE